MSTPKNQIPYWISDMQSMNQRQDLDKIPDSSSPLLVNISLARPGTWMKRKGSSLLGTHRSGKGVFGLIDYARNNGTNNVQAVRSIDLYQYNSGVFAAIDANHFPYEEKVESVVYKNRVYMTSPSLNLCYNTGGLMTDVGSGGNEIKGQTLAVAQQTLFIGCITSNENRIYYSLFNLATNQPGDQFWNDSEANLAASTRWFTVPGKNTALFSYGVTGQVYAFTEDACYSFDITFADNATGVKQVFDIGCCGPRAVTQCNGWMIWIDMSRRIWAWGGAGPPMPLSWDLEDEGNGEAIMNQISTSGLEDIAAGSVGNTFYFSVGNLSVLNRSLQNVVITGLLSQNLNSVLWSLYTYPARPIIFAKAKLGGKKVLLFGAEDLDNVYQMDNGTTDGGTAIDMFGITKFFPIEGPFTTKEGDHLLVKYRPQSVKRSYLEIRYSIDCNLNYRPISDPNTGEKGYGVVNMYDSSYSDRRDAMKKVGLPQDVRGRSISIEFRNNTLSAGCEVSGFGIGISSVKALDINIETT